MVGILQLYHVKLIFLSLNLETITGLMTREKYFGLFDPLRVLPINETHSACRLYTWWIFLCFLPENILSSGSNRVNLASIFLFIFMFIYA